MTIITRTEAQIRQDVAARVNALSGWTLHDVSVDQFSPGSVGDSVPESTAHLGFTVGVIESADMQGTVGRQVAGGIQTESTLVLVFLSRVTPKDKLAAEDAGTAAEKVVRDSLLEKSASWPVYFHLRWDRTSRSNPSGEWRVHTLRFTAHHYT